MKLRDLLNTIATGKFRLWDYDNDEETILNVASDDQLKEVAEAEGYDGWIVEMIYPTTHCYINDQNKLVEEPIIAITIRR